MDPGTGCACDDSGTVCNLGDNSVGQWAIEALTQQTFDFGTDDNNAHVQPGGTCHCYATDSYPFLQRCVKGEVDAAGGPAGPGGPGGPPPGGMQP